MKHLHTVHPAMLHRGSQRGAVSLLVALVLLFGMTLIAFFANRSFIFEQRTSANQYRSTKAFEAAEAGVEWALGKLNERLPLAAAPSCEPLAGAVMSFRNRFINPQPAGRDPDDANPLTRDHPTGWLKVNTAGRPQCRIDAAGVATCYCPEAALDAALVGANPEQSRFGVRFNLVADDPTAVEIISRGCSNGNTCNPAAADAPTSDSTAIVRVVVKIVPSIARGPAAAMTTGSAAVISGSFNVVNTDVPSNGITIHSGTAVDIGSGTSLTTVPGTPSRASVLDADATLAALSAAGEDAFFSAFFGQSLTNYRTIDPDVIRISGCGSATTCGAAVVAAINSGVQNPRIFIDSNVQISNGTPGLGSSLGTAANPVTIVTTGDLEFRSNLTAYGLFYAATATTTENWDYAGSSSATVFGAFISRGNFNRGSGGLNLIYDPSLWGTSGAPTGRLVRVPGSWRDKASDF